MRLGQPPDGDEDSDGLRKIEDGEAAPRAYTGFST